MGIINSHQDHTAAGFLSIGSLGNVIGKEDDPHELPEFDIEEAEKLQDALAKFLSRAKSKSGARGAEDGLTLDSCTSSLDVLEEHDEGDGDLSPNTKTILSMAKDLLVNNTGESRGSGIKNRSLKFLLRKMFTCLCGFASSRSLEINVRPCSTSTVKRCCLRHRTNGKLPRGNRLCREVDDEEEDCCTWDMTDSEFIVLEI